MMIQGVADHCAGNKVDSGRGVLSASLNPTEEGEVAFIALNRELDQHIQMGRLDAAEVGVLTLIHLQCDYRTLTWPGSAAKVSSLLRVTGKQARRILESLESKGFIQRQTTPGKRGNYPVQLTALSGRDMGKLGAMTTTTKEIENGSSTGNSGRAYGELESNSGHQMGQSSTSTTTSTKNKPKNKQETSTSSSPEAKRLTELLVSLMLENMPDMKPTNPGHIRDWEHEADLMHGRDGRSWEDAEKVLRWCQADPFWKANIRSISKFRKKYETLKLKMGNGNGHKSQPQLFPLAPVEPSEDPRWEGFVSYYRIAYAEDLRGATPPWTDRDSLELNRLLERNPNATTGQLKDMFVHWWQSDGQVKSELPHVWLPKLERWAASRIDRFGKAYE